MHGSYFLLGTDSTKVDILLEDEKASPVHAAIVWHEDGRLFLIDLKSSHGSLVDKKPVPPHKPTHLKHNSRVQFATSQEDKKKPIFTVRLENNPGEKRRNTDNMTTVRASHLLVKHKGSRRPSSWKVRLAAT